MTEIAIHAYRPAGGFEALHPRAPFAELIRLVLVAAEAIGRLRRGEAGTEAAHPAALA